MAASCSPITLALISAVLLAPTADSQQRFERQGPWAREAVFITAEPVPTFDTLGARGCLPAVFDFGASQELARDCAQRVTSDCRAIPAVTQFYDCLANSTGLIDGERYAAERFDADVSGYSEDPSWRRLALGTSASCRRKADARLRVRQLAVSVYFCFKWSLFATCDLSEGGAPSEAAARRRAIFLSGGCPLSPARLLDPVGLVTGRSWRECSRRRTLQAEVRSRRSGGGSQERYAAELRRVACLLQDFVVSSEGRLDLGLLCAAVSGSGGDAASTARLLTVVDRCGRRPAHSSLPGCDGRWRTPAPWCPPPASASAAGVTVLAFADCWARIGVLDCAGSEANDLALRFRQTCDGTIVS